MGKNNKSNTVNKSDNKKGGGGMVVARRSIELIIDTIGEILAFITCFLILFMMLNGLTQWLPDGVRDILTYVREVSIIALVLAKGMEFSLKKGWVLTGIFGAVCLAIIIMMWFPGAIPTWAEPFIG